MKYRKRDCVGEPEIQARLYVACKKAGLDCALQYVVNANQHNVPEQYRKATSVFDLVLIAGQEVVAIVEVKDPRFDLGVIERSGQVEKYKKHNVPVYIINSVYNISYLVKELVRVRDRFIETLEPTKAKCFEADRRREKRWDAKIATAFKKFDETFPDYKFTNHQSLEVLATGVKVLGLPDLLKQMTLYANVGDFFFGLSSLIKYANGGRDRFLNTRKGTVGSISAYYARQERFDEKQS